MSDDTLQSVGSVPGGEVPVAPEAVPPTDEDDEDQDDDEIQGDTPSVVETPDVLTVGAEDVPED